MVYLIHFETAFRHANHYIGFTTKNTLEQRMQHHANGSGSTLMRAVTAAGIKWSVVRIWPTGDRNFERKLKNHHKASRHCPRCNKNQVKHLYEQSWQAVQD